MQEARVRYYFNAITVSLFDLVTFASSESDLSRKMFRGLFARLSPFLRIRRRAGLFPRFSPSPPRFHKITHSINNQPTASLCLWLSLTINPSPPPLSFPPSASPPSLVTNVSPDAPERTSSTHSLLATSSRPETPRRDQPSVIDASDPASPQVRTPIQRRSQRALLGLQERASSARDVAAIMGPPAQRPQRSVP